MEDPILLGWPDNMTHIPPEFEEKCETEIVELHRFFEEWFAGRSEPGDFARFSVVLAPDFTMIGPDGRLIESQPLLEAVGKAGASKKGLRIWIEKVVALTRIGDVTLAVYEECQDLNGKTNRRRSSVLFRDNRENPNGLEWIHVHETWLDGE